MHLVLSSIAIDFQIAEDVDFIQNVCSTPHVFLQIAIQKFGATAAARQESSSEARSTIFMPMFKQLFQNPPGIAQQHGTAWNGIEIHDFSSPLFIACVLHSTPSEIQITPEGSVRIPHHLLPHPDEIARIVFVFAQQKIRSNSMNFAPQSDTSRESSHINSNYM